MSERKDLSKAVESLSEIKQRREASNRQMREIGTKIATVQSKMRAEILKLNSFRSDPKQSLDSPELTGLQEEFDELNAEHKIAGDKFEQATVDYMQASSLLHSPEDSKEVN